MIAFTYSNIQFHETLQYSMCTVKKYACMYAYFTHAYIILYIMECSHYIMGCLQQSCTMFRTGQPIFKTSQMKMISFIIYIPNYKGSPHINKIISRSPLKLLYKIGLSFLMLYLDNHVQLYWLQGLYRQTTLQRYG